MNIKWITVVEAVRGEILGIREQERYLEDMGNFAGFSLLK